MQKWLSFFRALVAQYFISAVAHFFIDVRINDEEKHSIPGENRSISADKIYEIVGFAIGDHYTVVSECDGNTDKQVLEFFKGFFDKIAEEVNGLSGSVQKNP